ncbi:MAG: ATP-grasp domain-containing protein [Chloroflexota bacterium]|nr:ATP-grasp domain-containing protein [Chloroflexota bacterium]
MGKRILLLVSASSYRSAAFLAAAERLGLEVVQGVDMPRELASYWRVELGLPFSQPEESAQEIARFAAQSPIDAIIPVDDGATLLAAQASALLRLAYNDPEAVSAARDKWEMRRRLHAAGVPCPEFRRLSLTDDPQRLAEQVVYPCVLKPLRLSGSRGVIRANDPAEFRMAFERIKRMLLADGQPEESTHLLAESFIPGFEVALEGLLDGGELRVLALFDKPDPLDGPFFEETIYVTPSRLSEAAQQSIAACAAAASAAIGLREGPVHAELRVNGAGPWMVELAGRSIGGLCSSVLEFGAGMTLEELIIRHAVGLDTSAAARRGEAAGVMMIPIPAGGRLRSFEGLEQARTVPFIEDVAISAKPGQRIVPLPEGSSYLGFIFAKGPSPTAVEDALRQAHVQLRFDIQPELPVVGGNMLLGRAPL